MCQMTVLLESNGQQEKFMENVTRLEVLPEGIEVSTMFEAPRLLPHGRIKTIDFMDGITVLTTQGGNPA